MSIAYAFFTLNGLKIYSLKEWEDIQLIPLSTDIETYNLFFYNAYYKKLNNNDNNIWHIYSNNLYFYNVYYKKLGDISNIWHESETGHSLIISSSYNSFDEYGDRIVIPPSSTESLVVNNFIPSVLTLNNTKVVNDEYGKEDIVLDFPDRVVNIVVDNSGSMTWNDESGLRYDLIKRFIERVSGYKNLGNDKNIWHTYSNNLLFYDVFYKKLGNDISGKYPGSVEYNIIKYGGKYISVLLSATTSDNNPLNPATNIQKIYEQDDFIDDASDFYGVRILRRKDMFSASPIDGEIIFDGIINKLSQTCLIENQTYYYSLYTYDKNYHFSNPTRISVVPRKNLIPKGVKTFYSEVLKGSGIITDNNVVSSWHFGEGNGDIVYDFTGYGDLVSQNYSSVRTQWLNKYEVPVGNSGIRYDSIPSLTIIQDKTIPYKAPFTFMAWFYPFDNSLTNQVIASNDNGVNYDWYVSLSAGNINFHTNNGSNIVSSIGYISQKEWHHLAITVASNGNTNIYIDGVLSNTGTSALSSFSLMSYPSYGNNFRTSIGSGFLGSLSFKGYITEVSIHNIERDVSYVLKYSKPSLVSDRDNGDRLIVLKYSIPNSFDYVGGKVRIVEKYSEVPSNEEDGEVIYDGDALSGDFYKTYKEELILDKTYNFRIFSQNSIGNYSHISDSVNLTVNIPNLSDEARQNLFPISEEIYFPHDLTIKEGNGKNYLKWKIHNLNDLSKRILIYFSTESFPSIEDNNFSGTLVFDGDIDDTGFVHRDLQNNQIYYYTIFSIDRYLRVSDSFRISGTPQSSFDDTGIPLVKINNLSYEIKDENTVNIFWDKLPNIRIVNAYFDQDIVLLAKLTDEFGNLIIKDVNVKLENNIESVIDLQSAEDVFIGENSFVPPNSQDIYNFVMSNMDSGISNGTLKLKLTSANNEFLLKNFKEIIINTKIKLFIPDTSSILDSNGNYTNNLFEYTSSEIKIVLTNPFNLEITNRDNRYINVVCKNSISALDNNVSTEVKKYSGAYVGSSQGFTVRCLMTYRGSPLIGVSSILTSAYTANKNLCDSSLPERGDISSFYNNLTGFSDTGSVQSEILDVNGNPTGEFETVTYSDILLNVPSTAQNILLYIKSSFGGMCFVKKMFLVFDSPLKIDMSVKVPLSDGMSISEQFANVYILDPNYPEDISKRSYPPDNTIVKWELTKLRSVFPDRLIYSTNNVPIVDGIYSYTNSGVTSGVFIGPISGVTTYDTESNIDSIYESDSLKATVLYNGISATDYQVIRILPQSVLGHASASSSFLMEFEDINNNLYTDGQSYIKMIISHDANTSNTKYSSCFRNCMNDKGKTIYELVPGQLVFINTNEPEIEIIWGNVIEDIDTYTGQKTIDITNATIGLGSAYVELSSGINTPVYFRINKNYQNQHSTGFIEKSTECKCIGNGQFINYYNEINVYGSITSIFNGSSIALTGGGDMTNGFPPTIIIPQEPVLIKVVDRKSGNISVKSLVVDGVSDNKIILDISFAGQPVPNGTPINLQIVNNFEEAISLVNSIIYTTNDIISDIDPINIRSYAVVDIEPIPTNVVFDSNLYITVNYDNLGNISRSNVLCIRFVYDAEYSINQSSTVFSSSVNSYDISTNSWTSVSSLKYERGYHCVQGVNNRVYSIGGINNKSIVNYVEEYNPITNVWTEKSSMPTSRMGALSVVVGNYIYVFGGIVYDSINNRVSVCNKTERYNTITNEWISLEDMPSIYLDTVDPVVYGNAYGAIVYNSGVIYILSGIRDISYDGLTVVNNDKVLSYTVATDSWSYSDTILDTEVENYGRIGPWYTFVSGNIFIGGGALQGLDQSLTYPTSIYKYDISTFSFDGAENVFSNIPISSYRTGISAITTPNIFYLAGGSNSSSQNISRFESVNVNSVSLLSSFTTKLSSMVSGKNGLGLGLYSLLGKDYILEVGGVESGRGNNFLKIYNLIRPNSLELNGKQHIEVEIQLLDEENNYPSSNIDVEVKGYVQFYFANNLSLSNIQEDTLHSQVLFDSNRVTTINGRGIVTLKPRADDIIKNIMSNLSFEEDKKNLRYKIIIQSIIYDNIYFGRNFIHIVSLFENIYSYGDNVCIDSSTNINIKSLNNSLEDNSKFSLISNVLYQEKSSSLDCIISRGHIIEIENLTEHGSVSASEGMLLIDSVKEEDPIGGSPLSDSLFDASNALSLVSYDNIKKNIVSFVDSEPNSSVNSLDYIISYINGIAGYTKVPVICSNMSVISPSIQPILENGTTNVFLNRITKETGGQSFTVVSSSFINDAIDLLIGNMRGTLGYGSAIYVVDLSEISEINCVTVFFNLYSNTNGKWNISVSDDNYTYSSVTDKFSPNYTAYFDKIFGRYIKFNMELFSELSSSNEEILVPGSPSITGISISYTPEKVDYLYINKKNIGSEVQQVVISTNSDNSSYGVNSIRVGTSTYDSHNWRDFDTISKPSKKESGKIIIPVRYGTASGNIIEQLVFVDGFMYKTLYGGWDQESIVNIYDKNNVLINYSEYKTYPREGIVIFNAKRSDNCRVEIVNPKDLRIGLKIINKTTNQFTYIDGVGYLNNTNQF